MKTYEFDVILQGLAEVSEEQADTLHTAGCDDGTPASSGGVTWIHFDREAQSLEVAIRTAVSQIQASGLIVARIEMTATAAAALTP